MHNPKIGTCNVRLDNCRPFWTSHTMMHLSSEPDERDQRISIRRCYIVLEDLRGLCEERYTATELTWDGESSIGAQLDARNESQMTGQGEEVRSRYYVPHDEVGIFAPGYHLRLVHGDCDARHVIRVPHQYLQKTTNEGLRFGCLSALFIYFVLPEWVFLRPIAKLSMIDLLIPLWPSCYP